MRIKQIKAVALSISILTISSLSSVPNADEIGPYVIHGGSQNFIYMGIIMTNSTLSETISIRYVNGVERSITAMLGARVYKWSQSSQSWAGSSMFDEFEEDWYPNLSVEPGDVLRIDLVGSGTHCYHDWAPIDHSSCAFIYQVGTPYVGSKEFTVKPGWNAFASPDSADYYDPTGYYADLDLIVLPGDKLYDSDRFDFSPCDSPNVTGFEWSYTGQNNTWTAHFFDPPQTFDTGPATLIGWGFYLHSASTTNRTWTATFPGLP